MKNFLILSLLLLSCNLLFSQNPGVKYSEVKITADPAGLVKIAKLGIAADEGYFKKGQYLHAFLTPDELQKVRDAGFSIEMIREDYSSFINERNKGLGGLIKEINRTKNTRYKSTELISYPVPQNFELGSMGGYYTLQEVMNELDSMRALYPTLVSQRMQAGSQNTVEGRKLWYVRISKDPDHTQSVPKVFYNALTHAREPEGMEQMIFYMWYLLENYATNEEAKYLVDNLELYFLPVVNPDGYEYNYNQQSFGGGMWRKNRKDNGDGSFGIDLNRNYGYQWGYDNNGSSPTPGDDTFRGTSAFSESETQNIRDLCNATGFKEALNYHTYSNLFLYPWSYITQDSPDSIIFNNFSTLMTRENRYTTGTPGSVLYNTNGDANDWMYGEQTSKPKVYSYTPETGNDLDGFWPFPDRIIPLCIENMYQNLMMAHLALGYCEAKNRSSAIVSQRQGWFKFDFVRYGLIGGSNNTVSIEPLDTTQIISVGADKHFGYPVQFEVKTDSIAYTLAPDMNIGTSFRYILRCNNGLYTFRDTVTKYLGPPQLVFSDDCNQFTNWTSTKWNVTEATYFSPTGCITDSPGANYSNNSNVSVTTVNTIDLKDSPVAVINFRTKFRTENGYDYVQVMVSANGGTFVPLKGRYTKNSSDNEDPGNPVYDGKQSAWVYEEVVLDNTANKDIKIRFNLVSDAGTRLDGYYFDDVTVNIIDMTTFGLPENSVNFPFISDPVPNPARQNVTVSYRFPEAGSRKFILCDLKGNAVKQVDVRNAEGKLTFDAGELPAGVYYYRIAGASGSTRVKKLVIIQ
jgi:carboxypeptidase T